MRKCIGSTVAAVVAGVAVASWEAPAQAQQGAMAKQIVGTWALVSAENVHPDGKKSYPFGPNPKGIVVFDAGGNFVVVNTNPEVPKFAANNRAMGTPEENKAVVSNSIGLFGTYTVDEASKTFTWRVAASTYPNWVGQEQKRPIKSVTATALIYVNPAASTAAAETTLVWKRLN